MNHSEIRNTINKFPGVRQTRREFLKNAATTAGLATIAFSLFGDLLVTDFDDRRIVRELNQALPPVNSETVKLAAQYDAFQEQALNFIEHKQNDELEALLKSEEFEQTRIASQAIQNREQKRNELDINTPRKKTFTRRSHGLNEWLPAITVGAAGLTGIFKLLPSRIQFQEQRKNAIARMEKLADGFNIESNPETFYAIDRALSYLPPVGGKIPLVQHWDGTTSGLQNLEPSQSAEEQALDIINLRRSGKLEGAYLQQRTVQGKLPDRFKFAALALIMNSPYNFDWNEPFSQVNWLKVQPLIHDGNIVKDGPKSVDISCNPYWSKVRGRTDFLETISVVSQPEPGSDNDARSVLLAAADNIFEERRILQEGRFYQRAAGACHALVDSAPPHIPHKVQRALAGTWLSFEHQTRTILGDYGLSHIGKVQWFMRVARPLPGWEDYGDRYEADFSPIQRSLIELEQTRQENSMRSDISPLITQITNRIDEIIGIPQLNIK